MARVMGRNYQLDDICTSMKKQMAVMWKLCEKYPSMDFLGCRALGIADVE